MSDIDLTTPIPDTPEKAQAELDTIHGEARLDEHHPYIDGKDPRHKAEMERVSKLHEIAARGRELGGDQAVREFKERNAEAQAKVEQEYAAEVKNLQDLGVDASQYLHPEKRKAFHVKSLKQIALLANGHYGELASSLRDSFRTIKPSLQMQLTLGQFEKTVSDGLGTVDLNAFGGLLIDYIVDRNTEPKNA